MPYATSRPFPSRRATACWHRSRGSTTSRIFCPAVRIPLRRGVVFEDLSLWVCPASPKDARIYCFSHHFQRITYGGDSFSPWWLEEASVLQCSCSRFAQSP